MTRIDAARMLKRRLRLILVRCSYEEPENNTAWAVRCYYSVFAFLLAAFFPTLIYVVPLKNDAFTFGPINTCVPPSTSSKLGPICSTERRLCFTLCERKREYFCVAFANYLAHCGDVPFSRVLAASAQNFTVAYSKQGPDRRYAPRSKALIRAYAPL
jgi:hypothetical protein